MKKFLQAMLAKMEARKSELVSRSDASTDAAEVRAIGAELDKLNADIAELRSKIDALPDEDGTLESRAQTPPAGQLNPLATYGVGQQAQQAENRNRELGRYETLEYRQAFMDFVLTGKVSEALQARDNATTHTTDISAVIPTTIMNKVVEKMADFGRIYARINKTNFKGGLDIPISSLKPTATWQAEGSVADKQKKTITAKISFGYYKLQCRIAVTLEAETVSLSVFETTIANNINEAIVVGIETAVIAGNGSGEPLGITKDTNIPAAQIVEVDASKLGEYSTWTKLLAKVPRKYRAGAVWILNDADWNKYIVGMVDANGQPVARTNYGLDGTITERFLGKEVIPVEDYIESVDAADSGDIFGIICRLEDYTFNSNMQLSVRKYFDEDTDEWITKATLLGDGKLADRNGVVLLKKK